MLSTLRDCVLRYFQLPRPQPDADEEGEATVGADTDHGGRDQLFDQLVSAGTFSVVGIRSRCRADGGVLRLWCARTPVSQSGLTCGQLYVFSDACFFSSVVLWTAHDLDVAARRDLHHAVLACTAFSTSILHRISSSIVNGACSTTSFLALITRRPSGWCQSSASSSKYPCCGS